MGFDSHTTGDDRLTLELKNKELQVLSCAVLAGIMLLWTNRTLADNTWEVNTQLMYGHKSLSTSDWQKSQQAQTERGLLLDIARDDWPVAITFNYFSASSDGVAVADVPMIAVTSAGTPTGNNGSLTAKYTTSVDTRTREFHFGLKKYLHRDRMRVSLGGGLSFTSAEMTYSAPNFSIYVVDTTPKILIFSPATYQHRSTNAVGPYLSGGIDRFITDNTSIGIQFMTSYVRGELDGQKRDLGGSHLGLSVGYRW